MFTLMTALVYSTAIRHGSKLGAATGRVVTLNALSYLHFKGVTKQDYSLITHLTEVISIHTVLPPKVERLMLGSR